MLHDSRILRVRKMLTLEKLKRKRLAGDKMLLLLEIHGNWIGCVCVCDCECVWVVCGVGGE